MLISYKHRLIFIHVGKTAGHSIQKALEPYFSDDYALIRWLRARKALQHCHTFPNHIVARDLRKKLSPMLYDHYFFKFAFVRNPWEREVSRYHFILNCTRHYAHEQTRRMSGFEEYLRAFRLPSQSDYLTDRKGQLIVDFVGRYERLREDFQYLCRKLNIPEPKLPRTHITEHLHYSQYYNEDTRQMIADRYQQDIRLFGYRYETP